MDFSLRKRRFHAPFPEHAIYCLLAVAASALHRPQATWGTHAHEQIGRNECIHSCSVASTGNPAAGATGLTARPAAAPAQNPSARRPAPLVAVGGVAHEVEPRQGRWVVRKTSDGSCSQRQSLRGNATAALRRPTTCPPPTHPLRGVASSDSSSMEIECCNHHVWMRDLLVLSKKLPQDIDEDFIMQRINIPAAKHGQPTSKPSCTRGAPGAPAVCRHSPVCMCCTCTYSTPGGPVVTAVHPR